MNFFRFFLIILFFSYSGISYSDNHDKKQEVLDQVKDIAKELEEEEEEVPLNDPFAGNEGTSGSNSNIPDEERDNQFSLYNFKLAGLISGKDYSYISLVNSSGEVMTLTLGQYLGKIQLVDLRLNEAIFKKEDDTYIIIDFNNLIRESNEY
jgi:Tfp pilus assembly protein PilP